MIGKHLSETLVNIENILWEFEHKIGAKPCYTHEGFRAALKIFMSAMMDKVWELQEKEGLSIDDRKMMVEKLGDEIRSMIKTYTDVDTTKLYG